MSYIGEENPPHLLEVLMFEAGAASTTEMLI